MAIRVLDPVLINQIAAGEVIERPSSVIKELIENSLDAGASMITVTLRDGGTTYMCVEDNGCGMDNHDLLMCVDRHATSKITDNNLFNIQSLGFRGEALASITSIARVSIQTRCAADITHTGRELRVEGGDKCDIRAVAMPHHGTRIEVSDLFYAIPARLKFLKSTSSELSQCLRVVEQLALSHADTHFKVIHNDRCVFDTRDLQSDTSLSPEQMRLNSILAPDFLDNALHIHHQDEDVSIRGYISLGTYHASQSTKQFFFINKRPIRDKVLQQALRVGYGDVLPSGRHGVCCLWMDLNPLYVDMNVHPAKYEVRFLDPNAIKSLLIKLVRTHLTQQPAQTSTHLSKALHHTLQTSTQHTASHGERAPYPPSFPSATSATHTSAVSLRPSFERDRLIPMRSAPLPSDPAPLSKTPEPEAISSLIALPAEDSGTLGHAVAQLFKSYIITQAHDAFYIVDQHAAAERLMYEKLKKHMNELGLDAQYLLIPDIVSVQEDIIERVQEHSASLRHLGVIIEPFGVGQLALKAIPALLEMDQPHALLSDLLNDLSEDNHPSTLTDRILHTLSTYACHHSVRFGRSLSLPEMNALLRLIESTPLATQCNHGRPAFIRLAQKDLERLFERT